MASNPLKKGLWALFFAVCLLPIDSSAVSPVKITAYKHSLPTEESIQGNEAGLELTTGEFDTKNGLTINETLLVNGLVRKTIVHLPKRYNASQKLPLVIVLHGAKLTGWIAQAVTGFDRLANQENFIVTYPDAINRQWDDGRSEGYTPSYGVNDVQFVSTLIDYNIWKYQADPRQIYVVGYSSGGMLTQKLGLELTDKISAIAEVASSFPMAQLNRHEQPSKPISVLMINGDADRAFPWLGGDTEIIKIKVGPVAPIMTTFQYWIDVNGGAVNGVVHQQEALQEKAGGTQVEVMSTRTKQHTCVLLYKINGGGHTWPGSEVPLRYIPFLGRQSRKMNASELIWEFFKQNDKDCRVL